MTRRSFLKRFCVAAAGLAVGAELLTDKCTATNVNLPAPKPRDGINPEWVNAQYEESFIFDEKTVEKLKARTTPWGREFGQHFYQIEHAYRPIYVPA